MDIDVVSMLRAQTPGCASGSHFNHAGASLPSRATLAAVTDHLHREALRGPMEAGADVAGRIEEIRLAASRLVNAAPDEIGFTSSGSAAWGIAFAALPPLLPQDRVLVGRHEWGGNLATLTRAASLAGATVEVIRCKLDGAVDPAALAAMLDHRVKLVSLTWLPANGGLVNDAVAVGRITRTAGVPYFIDAGQALGQIPVDVRAIGCDVLMGAGRKHLRGPRGTAILFVRKGFQSNLSPVFVDVLAAPWSGDRVETRDDARKFETSECSPALLLGLGSALDQALALGVSTIHERVTLLAQRLRTHISDIGGVKSTDLGSHPKSGLVSFVVERMDALAVRSALAAKQITVGVTGASYTPVDMRERGLENVVRASLSYLNTEAEVDSVAAAVSVLAAGVARGATERDRIHKTELEEDFMNLGLSGRTALIFGGSKGLGRGTAEALGAEGVALALVARDATNVTGAARDIAARYGTKAYGFAADLADPIAIERAIDEAEAALGGPADILLNNTGGPPPSGASGVAPEVWAEQFKAMVLSVVRITDRVLPAMRARKWGRILTITSTVVVEPNPVLGLSNALRSSLVGWSKTLASEVARDGVTVNTLLPGQIATDRTLFLDQSAAERQGMSIDAVKEAKLSSIPAGRYGTPDEFGAVAAFLASEHAAYVTGTMMRVDGGVLRSV